MPEGKLKRELSLFKLTMYGIGLIIGAGIYAIIGKTAGLAGNATWLSFVIGAVIATLTGLSYAELGSMFPKDAGEYIYVREAAHRKYPAFLIGWLMVFIGIVASATVSLGFAGYLNVLTGFPVMAGAAGLIIAATILNFWGMRESAMMNMTLTLISVLGLSIVILLGVTHLNPVNYFEMPNGISGVFSGAILIFFAFLGFDEIVNLAQETKNPRKIIPRAIFFSMAITTILYILVSMVAVGVVPWNQLSKAEAPLALVVNTAMPGAGYLLSIIALFATANTVLAIIIVQSRVLWGMSKEKSLPAWLSQVHPIRKTPWVAILVTMVVALLFVLWGDIRKVAEVSDVGMFLVFIAVNASLIVIRYKYPNLKRPFRVPFNIGWFPVLPAIGIAVILALMMYTDAFSAVVVTGILVLGTIFFILMQLRKKL